MTILVIMTFGLTIKIGVLFLASRSEEWTTAYESKIQDSSLYFSLRQTERCLKDGVILRKWIYFMLQGIFAGSGIGRLELLGKVGARGMVVENFLGGPRREA